ncbi:hypothetical protein CRG98_018187 [Punica granatum]|uniref:Uncharacterized protein n=1 Tax=Punica granatum TaxID=22663 RepID=A0A2I0K008_PUNGR|nr:hypothetical protein CRG98_018187 [Punica granatum]
MPDVGPKPHTGLKPTAGRKSDAGPKPKSSKCKANARCGAEAPYRAEAHCRAEAAFLLGISCNGKRNNEGARMFAISMQEFREANWPDMCEALSIAVDGQGHAERCASDHVVTFPVVRGEDRGWSTHEGWHDSPVMWGGWLRWTATSHDMFRHGEVKTAGGLTAKVGTTRLSCGTW